MVDVETEGATCADRLNEIIGEEGLPEWDNMEVEVTSVSDVDKTWLEQHEQLHTAFVALKADLDKT